MKIEIAEPGRMTQSGSSLLRLIQNNNMPVLDLLVRESIQNSLDASNGVSDHVKVEFITGKFETRKFNAHLEGVEEKLNNLIKDSESIFLAIKDSNTSGLTGKMHYDQVESNDYGNLLKLVYEISKPQESIGAGGSWGLGKTIYFRVGIGLVVYYSRVLNENNNYESRLAVSLVEDEKGKNSIIPQVGNKVKRGIAWWGEEIDKNKTIPITDEKVISKILSIFNIEMYDKNETGTTVIIPYIDEKKVLLVNKSDIEEKNQYWNSSIEEYLKIAVQRWYAPRIDNIEYPYGNWLKVLINANEIKKNKFEPIFKVIQDIYISAVNNSISINNEDINRKSIIIKNELINQKAGCLVYTKVNKQTLKMIPPDNKFSPFKYINVENLAEGNNKPIVLFTRRPGMIVAYETTGEWVDSISETNSDEFIIGIFVLNSDNKLIDAEDITLEEYVRQSEKADHTSWNDWTIGSSNHRIISKIQYHVRSAISKTYNNINESENDRRNIGLGKLLGDILLPPENFGNRASGNLGSSNGGSKSMVNNGVKLKVHDKMIKYYKDGVEVPFTISSKKSIQECELNIGILAENGKISVAEWEEVLEQATPFSLKRIILNQLSSNGTILKENFELKKDNDSILKDDMIDVKFTYSSKKIPYGIKFIFFKDLSFEIKGILDIEAFDRNIKPVLDIQMIEGSK